MGAEVRKTRPSVVVSNDINNLHSPIVSIAPITSSVARIYSFEVEIPAGTAGLRKRSKVMVNQTRPVDKLRFLEKKGRISNDILSRLDSALRLHYSL